MNPIIVAGTGRCGSSALSRILIELGVFMGEKFSPPDKANPKGFYEDLDFKNLHQVFLDKQISYDEFCASILKLAEMRAHYPIWGFKDPRSAQFIPIYKRALFPHSKYIWMQRDPRDIQWSMLRAYPDASGGNQPWLAYQVWMVRHNILEQWLPACDKNAMRVHFDDLMERPSWVIEHVCDFLHIAPGGEKIEAAIQTIQKREETPDGLGAPNLK